MPHEAARIADVRGWLIKATADLRAAEHDCTLLRRAAPLREYAWKFRYPRKPEEPTREEVQEALATARTVWDAVMERLPAEVRPG